MTDIEFLVNLLIALGVGGVVGIEREHRGDAQRVIAGVRTFPLIAAAGLLVVRVGQELQSDLPLSIGLLAAVVFSMALFAARHSMGVTGLTTPAAMFVTFLAGVLIGFDMRIEGLVVGVATALLLVSKRRLHGIAHHLTDEEVMSAVQFVTLAFILFPLVASIQGPVDPYGLVGPRRLIDPYWVLLIVVFVSAISFASFLAMRTVGAQRGIEVSGLLGGLVNSEATTASLATLAREDATLVRPALVGTFLTTATMFVRNLSIAVFVDFSFQLARFMAPALGVMALATLAIGLTMERRMGPHPTPQLKIGNPFAIWPALRFALVFLVISVLAFGARQLLGPWGVYASLVGALVSGGAVVASVGTLAVAGEVDFLTAGIVAVLACVIGAANKVVVLRATNLEMHRRAATSFLMVAAVGVVALAGTALLWGAAP